MGILTEVSDIDLSGLGADLAGPDAEAAAQITLAPAAGRLGELAQWLASTGALEPVRTPGRVRLLYVGDDAGAVEALAADAGVAVWTIATGSFEDGVAAGDRAVDSGADMILVAGAAGLDACALAICAISLAEPVAVLPRGAAAVDTTAWIARATLVRDRRAELIPLRDRPDELLSVLAEPALSTACGLIARAVSRRTCVILDGDLAVTAALVAHQAQPAFAQWWRVADTSTSPIQNKALSPFDQRPILDLGIETADGTAALLALATLRGAATAATPQPGARS